MNIVFWLIILITIVLIWIFLAKSFVKIGQILAYIEADVVDIMTRETIERNCEDDKA